jgi:hypothetical protein
MEANKAQGSTGADGLADRFANGWLMLLVVRHLTRAYQAGRVECARFFFLAAYQAAFDSAVAALGDLTAALEPGPQAEDLRARTAALQTARLVPTLPLDDDPPSGLALTLVSPTHLAALEAAYAQVFDLLGPAAGIDPRPLEEFVSDDVGFLMDLMSGGCF